MHIQEIHGVNPYTVAQTQSVEQPQKEPTVDTGVSGVQPNPSQNGKIIDTYA